MRFNVLNLIKILKRIEYGEKTKHILRAKDREMLFGWLVCSHKITLVIRNENNDVTHLCVCKRKKQ